MLKNHALRFLVFTTVLLYINIKALPVLFNTGTLPIFAGVFLLAGSLIVVIREAVMAIMDFATYMDGDF